MNVMGNKHKLFDFGACYAGGAWEPAVCEVVSTKINNRVVVASRSPNRNEQAKSNDLFRPVHVTKIVPESSVDGVSFDSQTRRDPHGAKVFEKENLAMKSLERYPVGQSFKCFCDPKHPDKSSWRCKSTYKRNYALGSGLVALACLMFIPCFPLVVWSIWAPEHEAHRAAAELEERQRRARERAEAAPPPEEPSTIGAEVELPPSSAVVVAASPPVVAASVVQDSGRALSQGDSEDPPVMKAQVVAASPDAVEGDPTILSTGVMSGDHTQDEGEDPLEFHSTMAVV